MMNPFPELLAFQFVIITFLRIVVSFVFIYCGFFILFKNRPWGTEFFRLASFPFPRFWMYFSGSVQFFGGLLLLVGAFVQYSAILLSVITFGALLLKDRGHPYLKKSPEFYMLLFAVTFSFIFFGAGAFAFDLPL